MKGNQGLEALAALCGGASHVVEESEKNKFSQQIDNEGIRLGNQGSSQHEAGTQVFPSSTASSHNPSQQWQQYLAGQMQAVPGTFTGVGVTFPGAQSLQQMAFSIQGQYQAFMQAHAAQMAQQYAQQQQQATTLPPTFMDPATVAALAAKAFSQGPQPPVANNAPPAAISASISTHQLNAPNSILTAEKDFASKEPSNELSETDSLVRSLPDISGDSRTLVVAIEQHPSDKKEAKRAANRRSAQLSRKRKKHFIEELKEENDDLRRKEQILRSIPDLIVMFNSAGILGFVSHSVSTFLDFKPEELEGTSFWHRLCDESVRLLKAAFMDALAARTPQMNTAPLGDGLWEIRLRNKDGSQKLVTLNGVVHFSGRDPECVCSIRPNQDDETVRKSEQYLSTNLVSKLQVQESESTGIVISPQQSVISCVTDDSTKISGKMNIKSLRDGKRIAQISDGECTSESGSDRS